MPAGVAALWLGAGLGVIALAMIAGMIMPRPGPAPNWVTEWAARSNNPSATAVAPNAETAADGQGRPGSANNAADAKANPADGKRGNPDLNAKSKSDRGKKGEKGRDFSKESTDTRGSKDGEGSSEVTPQTQLFQTLADMLQQLARWMVMALLAVVAVLFVLRRLAVWNRTAQHWYAKLFGWLARLFGRESTQPDDGQAEPLPARPRPANYSNPFDGGAAGRDTAELVAFSFAALAAWAERAARRAGLAKRRTNSPSAWNWLSRTWPAPSRSWSIITQPLRIRPAGAFPNPRVPTSNCSGPPSSR